MNENMQAAGRATADTLLVRAVFGCSQTSNLRPTLALICLLLATVCLVAEAVQDQPLATGGGASGLKQTTNEAQQGPGTGTGAINLEELNSMVQQYNEDTGSANRQLASDIIQRLMLDNLTGASWRPAGELDVIEGPASDDESYELAPQQSQQDLGDTTSGLSRLDTARLRKLMAMVESYGENADDGHGVFQYASLPISEAATMKRAKMLLMRQQQGGRITPYSRGSFDFGLGKRGQSFLRRFGDLEAGQVSPVIQYGKRPAASAHRYDFGLGKRVVSPSAPRFDFGLGKRSPVNRNRFDFGLGKK